MRRALALAVVLAALAPVSAHAATAAQRTQVVDSLRPLAAAWWGAQGRSVDCPQGVTVTVVRMAQDDGLAETPGCHMWLDTDMLNRSLARVHELAWSRETDEYVCMVFLHEWGHLTGLPHIPGGIMDAGPGFATDPPAACVGWAIVRHPRPHTRAAHARARHHHAR
jgi:hypothetical protein